jgi:hypothetical protein
VGQFVAAERDWQNAQRPFGKAILAALLLAEEVQHQHIG